MLNKPKFFDRTNDRVWKTRGLVMFALIVSCFIGYQAIAAAEPELTDHSITNAIEDEFLFDSAVPYNSIDVRTIDGIVTLNGTVNNLLAKDRAREIAGTVRGVRAVVNEVEVRPTMERSDEAVELNVEKALALDPATDAYEITVEANDGGVVTLIGTVDSWPERQLCETVSKGAAGVTAVKNEIAIKYKTNRTDGEIKPEIESRLRWDTLVDDALIDVEVRDGDVSLSGTVGSVAERRRARSRAWVAGVKSVSLEGLNVERWARDDELRADKYVVKSDDDIRDAVKSALLYDPRVYSFNVVPTVSSGVATLEGIVDNAKAKQAAEQDARNTVGVVSVKNRIKVRTETELPDQVVANNVRDALLLDPIVEKYEISVKVLDGVTHLHGTVDTYLEKLRAEDVVYRSNGVIAVRNHLDVEFKDHFSQSPYVYPYWSYSPPYYTRVLPDSWKTDGEITSEIENQLWWSPYVDEGDVNVVVNNGVATLTGTVDSWSEYNAARNNAFEAGALHVINDLKVE